MAKLNEYTSYDIGAIRELVEKKMTSSGLTKAAQNLFKEICADFEVNHQSAEEQHPEVGIIRHYICDTLAMAMLDSSCGFDEIEAKEKECLEKT